MKRIASISHITIPPGRVRREFSETANQELQNSINRVGLLQPLVLEENGADSFILRAGERRFRAISEIYELGGRVKFEGQELPQDSIPYVLMSDLSEIDRLQIEVDENDCRVDFTWQERAEATAKLFKLRSLQSEESVFERPAPTVGDIAEELTGNRTGTYQDNVRKDLILAKHLDNPEVAAAPNAREAFKILKRKEAREKNAQLAETLGKDFNSSVHHLYNEDAETWIAGYQAESFDVVILDPPYGMGADEFGDSGGKGASHEYSDSSDVVDRLLTWVPEATFRITKPQAHIYLFCDIDWFTRWREALKAAGWNVFRTPIIWYKPGAYRAPWPEHGPQRKYELCLYAVKGQRPVLKLAGDVLTHAPDENLGHAAQKPVALYQELLTRSARAGDTVIDFFCGSGTIFPAAHALKCMAVGVERDPAFYAIAAKRIKNLSGD